MSFLPILFLSQELLRTVELVRTDIDKNLRTSLGAMVVMDVHNRDTTEELVALQVRITPLICRSDINLWKYYV